MHANFALQVFQDHSSPHTDLAALTCLLKGYIDNGQSELALKLFDSLKGTDCVPDARLYVVALGGCASLASRDIHNSAKCLEKGLEIHGLAVRNRCCDRFVENALINMYSRCGSISRARQVFDEMAEKNVVSWTTLIQGYVKNGKSQLALQVFDEMQGVCAANRATYVAALSACASLAKHGGNSERWLINGQEIHSRAVNNRSCDMFVESTLVHMYAKFGRMELAQQVFDKMKHRSLVSWNALIQGYVDEGSCQTALALFHAIERSKYVSPNPRTFLAAITACSQLAGVKRNKEEVLKKGRRIHALAMNSGCCDCHVETALVDMYAELGEMKSARSVFNGMNRPNVVSWTALIGGYVENGESKVALDIFERMTCPPDTKTFVAVLKACTALAAQQKDQSEWLKKGKSIHSQAALSGNCDPFVENTLVHMYAECGVMVLARIVFDEMREKCVVSWNTLIGGYVKNGMNEVALKLICEMDVSGCKCDSETFLAALMACANLLDVERGRAFHAEIQESNLLLETCLVSLYSRSGYMDEAEHAFDTMKCRDTCAWNMLIGGYSREGSSRRVFELFQRMKEEEVGPDEVTFTHLLAACSHAGMTARGKEFFTMMISEYGMTPHITHCNCMIDMFCRADSLDEALTLVKHMPFKPNDMTRTMLLNQMI